MDFLAFLVDELWQKWLNINLGIPWRPLGIPDIFGIFLA